MRNKEIEDRFTIIQKQISNLRPDKKDLKLIQLLSDDGRKSISQLANESGFSRPTIMSRLDKMMKRNLLRVDAAINIKKTRVFNGSCGIRDS